MRLSNDQKKLFRTIGHNLKPIVTVSESGLTEGVIQELNRAFEDHELFKVKISVMDRDKKQALISELCDGTSSILVHTIGKTALVYRSAKTPNPKLSNIIRNQQ